MVQRIIQLSSDPVSSVRMRVADFLGCMEKTYPSDMYNILEKMLKTDTSSPVLHSLMVRLVHRLVFVNPEKAWEFTETVAARTDIRGDVAAQVHEECVARYLDLYLYADHLRSEQRIKTFTTDVLTYTSEATTIVNRIREHLVVGPVHPAEPKAEVVRKRSFRIFEEIAGAVQSGYRTLSEKNQGKSWPSEDAEKARAIMQLIDHIASQMLFAVRADAYRQVGNQAPGPLPREIKTRFLSESDRLFDLLIAVPHPSIVHQLVETLVSLLETDPRRAFLKVVSIVKAARAGGYQREHLATGLIVDLANRIFADYRPMLQDYRDAREAMDQLLDIFVQAGWPQAMRITYRLDEIFR